MGLFACAVTFTVFHLLLLTDLHSQETTASGSSLRINEFLAKNVRTNPDLDSGGYFDWIELYNSSDQPIDLTGYNVSDDYSQPQRWTIPGGTVIDSGGYLLLWADGTAHDLHANFKLGSDGEQIVVSTPEGSISDSVTFNSQLEDVSYGRLLDRRDEWAYFPHPTPGGPNSTSHSNSLEKPAEPTVSPKGGLYVSGQTVELRANEDGHSIRYTLDGSPPTSESLLYDNPLTIDSTSVLIVRAFADGYLPSDPNYNTYIINEPISLPIVSITIDPQNLWNDEYGIYSVGTNGLFMRGISANYWQEWERPIHLELYEDGERVVDMNAGLAINGARRNSLQKSFRVFARGKYGKDTIQYRLFDGKPIDSFSSIILRNGGYPEFQYTAFKDGMLQALIASNMDIDYQAYKPAVLLVNGEYWGIYNIREKQNEEYLESNHGVDPDRLDILERDAVVIEGDATGYRELIKFIEEHPMSDANNYAHVLNEVDIDEYLNYQIAQIYIANFDWPGRNIKFWRPQGGRGKWRWLLFDIDVGTSVWTDFGHNILEIATAPNSTRSVNPPWSTLLLRSLLENPGFRDEFVQRSCAHLNSTFKFERFSSFIDEYSHRVEPEIERHIARWSEGCDPSLPAMADSCVFSSKEEWEENVSRVRRFARNRPEHLMRHIQDKFGLDDPADLKIEPNLDDAATYSIQGVELLGNLEGTYFKNVPLRISAVPRAGYTFVRWEGLATGEQDSIVITLLGDSILRSVFKQSSQSLVPGEITGHTVLRISRSPYMTTGDVTVRESAVLEIEPGVVLLMADSASIFVEGEIRILGSAAEPVTIRPNTAVGADHWGALIVIEGIAQLRHLNLSGATSGPDPADHRAAISAYRSDLFLDFVSMDDVVSPIFVQYGTTRIENTFIHSAATSDLISVKFGDVAIENCVLRGGSAANTDAIDFGGVHDGIIRGNTIFNFLGDNSDGIDLGEGSTNILVEDNVIFNCFDRGISVGQGSSVRVRNNVIGGCNVGVGIKDPGSFAFIDRSTFYNNNIAVSSFGKKIGSGGGTAGVVNSIFANSRTSSIYSDQDSSVDVTYSLSNVELLPGKGNIFESPQFANARTRDFRLQAGSPGIDAGDPEGFDEDGSRADMGIESVHLSTATALQDVVINEINYNSSASFDPGDWVELYNPNGFRVDLSGWMFTDGNVDNLFVFPDESYADPAGYVILSSDIESFQVSYQDTDPVGEELGFRLSSNGETLTLFNVAGGTVDLVAYGSESPWPIEPNGGGFTLELISPAADNSHYSNWVASTLNGTPGRINSAIDQGSRVADDGEPSGYSLSQNWPNPFNSTTTIGFSLADAGEATLELYDILGRLVATLVDEPYAAGSHEVKFNLDDIPGSEHGLASGVYVCKFTVGGFSDAMKMVVVR